MTSKAARTVEAMAVKATAAAYRLRVRSRSWMIYCVAPRSRKLWTMARTAAATVKTPTSARLRSRARTIDAPKPITEEEYLSATENKTERGMLGVDSEAGDVQRGSVLI